REAVGTVFGAGEYQYLVPVAAVDEMHQEVALVLLGHAIYVLLDALGGRVARRHFNGQWLAQRAGRQRSNVRRIGRREHQRRALAATCAASSRVGVSTSARGRRPDCVASFCKIGSTNAAVLPVPVCAPASTSRPASTPGMAAR